MPRLTARRIATIPSDYLGNLLGHQVEDLIGSLACLQIALSCYKKAGKEAPEIRGTGQGSEFEHFIVWWWLAVGNLRLRGRQPKVVFVSFANVLILR